MKTKELLNYLDSDNLIYLEKITIDRSFLEHLLNCLANQKYIHSLRDEDKTDFQAIIDKAWSEGMDILHNSYY